MTLASHVAQYSGDGVRHYSNTRYRFSRYRRILRFLRLVEVYSFRFSIFSLVYSFFDSVRPKFRRWTFGIIQTRWYRFSRYRRRGSFAFCDLRRRITFVFLYIHLYILSLIRCAQNSGDRRSALFKHDAIDFRDIGEGSFAFCNLRRLITFVSLYIHLHILSFFLFQ
jgi:hypothetical protein